MSARIIPSGNLSRFSGGFMRALLLESRLDSDPILIVINSTDGHPAGCRLLADIVDGIAKRGNPVAVFVERAIGPASTVALAAGRLFVNPTGTVGGFPLVFDGETRTAAELIDAGLATSASNADDALQQWQQQLVEQT